MCCRSLPGVFGCPNPTDFGQMTGASPGALLCLRTELCLCVSHTILPEWPHCRDLRLPRKQPCLHTKPQAKPSTECDGPGHVAQGGLRELPKPVCLQPSCLHIPGCPQALGAECAATCRTGRWPGARSCQQQTLQRAAQQHSGFAPT